MTVQKLRAILEKINPDAEVCFWIERADLCYAERVESITKGNYEPLLNKGFYVSIDGENYTAILLDSR